MADNDKRPDQDGKKDLHPGMMGDQTEEQNLGQEGDPKARITREEVEKAFGDKAQDSSGKNSRP
ncbi:MAG TPA: hypothetical protein VG248_02695 [Caulobacteraceae bacterium]|jgi:hypothetical protein|nr:hypothetical protein [Caulobacteraceae bacterium]